jgi:hypothetical protein
MFVFNQHMYIHILFPSHGYVVLLDLGLQPAIYWLVVLQQWLDIIIATSCEDLQCLTPRLAPAHTHHCSAQTDIIFRNALNYSGYRVHHLL